MDKIIVDANSIVGLLIRDEDDLEKAIMEHDELIISEVTVFETVYVLEKGYKVDREVIFDRITRLLSESKIQSERVRLLNTLLKYRNNTGLSFADCYLWELGETLTCRILTRDKKLLDKIRL